MRACGGQVGRRCAGGQLHTHEQSAVIGAWHRDGLSGAADRISGQHVVDGDHRRVPRVGGVAAGHAGAGLLCRVVEAAREQPAELGGIGGGIEVAPHQHRPAARRQRPQGLGQPPDVLEPRSR